MFWPQEKKLIDHRHDVYIKCDKDRIRVDLMNKISELTVLSKIWFQRQCGKLSKIVLNFENEKINEMFQGVPIDNEYFMMNEF